MDAPQQPPMPKPSLDPKDRIQMRVRAAERAHDDETAFGKGANEAAIKAGEEAIKAAILINGGSSVAMLAFIGTLDSKDMLSSAELRQVTAPLLSFGSGVGLAVVAGTAAYFTNLMIAGSSSRKQREYEEPFLRSTPSSRRHWFAGEFFRYIAVIAVLASMLCFGWGLFRAEAAFRTISAPKPLILAE
jgi:hypothetical protein